MMLCKFGPKRLSPSLVVWQVRHALLNINCPDPASAPARAGSWGTADDDSRIRNVEQASPTIAMRGMKASISECVPLECVPLTIKRAVATMRSSVRAHARLEFRNVALECRGPEIDILVGHRTLPRHVCPSAMGWTLCSCAAQLGIGTPDTPNAGKNLRQQCHDKGCLQLCLRLLATSH